MVETDLGRDETTPVQWRSRAGFMLATLGAAVGLGNIWRFAYTAGENGGAAFVLVYLAAVLLLGWPLLIAELALGRATRGDALTAFQRIASYRLASMTGWLGMLACIVILSYYPVVTGWVAHYLWRYLSGIASQSDVGSHAVQFETLIADPLHALVWFTLVMLATIAIVAAGVEHGIERASTWLMPVFLLLVVALALHGLTLEGAGQAVAFLFTPDWSVLTRPRTYLAAVGQAFFSIGLAMGVLVTYGAYVPAHVRIPRAALVIVLGDAGVALLAGLMIFPAVFTYGVSPVQGATLAFAALPEVFAQMPGGRWLAVLFFLLLLIAALTSAVALLEVPVAWVVARGRWRRSQAAVAVGAFAIVAGVPSALSYGVLAPPAGLAPLLERIDHFASNVLLPLSAIAIALFVGWAWRGLHAREAADLKAVRLGAVWHWSMRAALPAVIALVMARGLGWF